MVACGTGATLRLQIGGSGAPLRSQRELGLAPFVAGRATSRSGAAARAFGRDHRACGDEVSGAGGARQSHRLSAHGRSVFQVPLQQPSGRRALCGLARCVFLYAPADSGFSPPVSKSPSTGVAAAGIGGRGTGAGSGDGAGNHQPRRTALGARGAPDAGQRT